MQKVLGRKPDAKVDAVEPHLDSDPRGVVVRGTYSGKTAAGVASAMQQISIALEYQGWFAVLNYYIPQPLFQKYLPVFRQMVDAFQYTGR